MAICSCGGTVRTTWSSKKLKRSIAGLSIGFVGSLVGAWFLINIGASEIAVATWIAVTCGGVSLVACVCNHAHGVEDVAWAAKQEKAA